jgi:hypothetical protein
VCVYTRRPTGLLLIERWFRRPVKPPGGSSVVCTVGFGVSWGDSQWVFRAAVCGLFFVSGKVCEGEARPNQRALAGVYQQMLQSCVAMGKEQRAARTCGGSNVRNTVLDLRDLPNRPDSASSLIDMTTKPERLRTACTCVRFLDVAAASLGASRCKWSNFQMHFALCRFACSLSGIPRQMSSVVATHQRDIQLLVLPGLSGFDCHKVAKVAAVRSGASIEGCCVHPQLFGYLKSCKGTLHCGYQRPRHCTSCVIVNCDLSSVSYR